VYARTKRAAVVLTEMWAGRLAATGITVHAMHPGWADTAGVQSSLPRFYRVTRPLLRSPDQGADTIVWLGVPRSPRAARVGFGTTAAAAPRTFCPEPEKPRRSAGACGPNAWR